MQAMYVAARLKMQGNARDARGRSTPEVKLSQNLATPPTLELFASSLQVLEEPGLRTGPELPPLPPMPTGRGAVPTRNADKQRLKFPTENSKQFRCAAKLQDRMQLDGKRCMCPHHC